MGRTLTTAQAKAFYDRFGARQDAQSFYEDRAIDVLVVHGVFSTATSVFEFGCGTGRFAKRLLAQALPPEARYMGVDVSSAMVCL
jgi:ubiquinone/menaquinone biosynthesis C-methylase UbiE